MVKQCATMPTLLQKDKKITVIDRIPRLLNGGVILVTDTYDSEFTPQTHNCCKKESSSLWVLFDIIYSPQLNVIMHALSPHITQCQLKDSALFFFPPLHMSR